MTSWLEEREQSQDWPAKCEMTARVVWPAPSGWMPLHAGVLNKPGAPPGAPAAAEAHPTHCSKLNAAVFAPDGTTCANRENA